MEVKKAIVSSFGRDALKAVVDDLSLENVDRRSPETMREVLSRSRSIKPGALLEYLYKDEVKLVCEAMGLSTQGRKADLVQRVLNNGAQQKTLPSGGQSKRTMSNDKPTADSPANNKPATSEDKKLDAPALEQWLWEAACIRGALDTPKFKDYILPLIFLKRLSDVFEDEIKYLAHEFGDEETASKLVDQDHKPVRFYMPQEARWSKIATVTTGLGEFLTDAVRAVARENPRLSGVIDITDFNATAAGQRIVDDSRLSALIQVLNNPHYRLGMYDPQPGHTVYDPCCGSGGLLIKCHLRLLEKNGKRTNGRLKLPSTVAPLKLYGQHFTPATYAMARMNTFIHDMEAEIALGDTCTGLPSRKEMAA